MSEFYEIFVYNLVNREIKNFRQNSIDLSVHLLFNYDFKCLNFDSWKVKGNRIFLKHII